MITANAIEYITRDLFKGKKLKTACNAFVKKFKGECLFIGNVDYTSEELQKAVINDKIKNCTDIKYIPSIAIRFNLSEEELTKAFKESTK